jgi:hypothetical protein
MSPKQWGTPTWIFLHAMAHKVHPGHFSAAKAQLFGILSQICEHLPCPECAQHATMFVRNINVARVNEKTDFINLLFVFHNMVNRRKHHRQFKYDDMYIYDSVGIIPAFNDFARHFNTDGNLALISESFRRHFMMKSLKKWFLRNIHLFELGISSPPAVQLSITA